MLPSARNLGLSYRSWVFQQYDDLKQTGLIFILLLGVFLSLTEACQKFNPVGEYAKGVLPFFWSKQGNMNCKLMCYYATNPVNKHTFYTYVRI